MYLFQGKFETDFDLRFFDFLCDERNETLKSGFFNMKTSLAQTGKKPGSLIYFHYETDCQVHFPVKMFCSYRPGNQTGRQQGSKLV